MKNMIDIKICQSVLEKCLSTGGDFAEIFAEETTKNSYSMVSGELKNASTNNLHGASIRILKGAKEISGYTNDFSLESLMKLAENLSESVEGENLGIKFTLKEEKPAKIVKAVKAPSKVSNEEKVALLTKASKAAKEYSEEVVQVMASLMDEEQHVLVANSFGKYIEDDRHHLRLAASAVAAFNGSMQTANDSIGGNCGYEIFDEKDVAAMGKEIAKAAVTMAHADEMVGGVYTVVIDNAFGGVLLHEACVHSLEATSVAKGASVMCGKLGQKIASDIVTAIDDGTRCDQWGSLNMDDEGNPTHKNVLIENGILKSYLVDYRNSRIMNHPITGSSRRQNYRYSPTSRMTNTFFAPGKDTFDSIIANTKFGLYAKKMGGGSVNPSTGEFNFAVNEGYMIEDGKITKPVRGATLVGSGSQVLLNIDMIADNLDFGHGMCGSASGSIPTDVGQPTIRVQNMVVGGRGSK